MAFIDLRAAGFGGKKKKKKPSKKKTKKKATKKKAAKKKATKKKVAKKKAPARKKATKKKAPARKKSAKKKATKKAAPRKAPARAAQTSKVGRPKKVKCSVRTWKGCTPPKRGKGGKFLYPRVGKSACYHKGVEKEESRAKQRLTWRTGFRPAAPPRQYKPGPIGQIKSGDPDVRKFDKIIVHFSGGKDSVAALLYLIELVEGCGLDRADVIECWHASVDGNPHARGKRHVFDWPITEAYCISICNHLGVPLLFQWRDDGIQGGMFAERGDYNGNICFEDPGPEGPRATRPASATAGSPYPVTCLEPVRPKEYHRLRWPKLAGIDQGRFCSAYVKKEPAEGAFKAQDYRFNGKRVLMVTGERREESSNRAGYEEREWDTGSGHGKVPRDAEFSEKRYVEMWKAVLDWCEIEVWAIIAKYCLTPHPSYMLGFGRLSCLMCIFSSKSQLETIKSTSAEGARRFATFQKIEANLKKTQLSTRRGDWRPRLGAKACCPVIPETAAKKKDRLAMNARIKERNVGRRKRGQSPIPPKQALLKRDYKACSERAAEAAVKSAMKKGASKTEARKAGAAAKRASEKRHVIGSQKDTIAHTMKSRDLVKEELVDLAKSLRVKSTGDVGSLKAGIEKAGGKIRIPLPIAKFKDAPLRPKDQIDPDDAPRGPKAAYHRKRAEAGLAVAYHAAAENPWLVAAAMKHNLPSWWSPTTDYWRKTEPFEINGRVREGAWLPAGAFGEDAGPT